MTALNSVHSAYRSMLHHPPDQERDGEKDRKPGGKTCVKVYGKCGVKVKEEDVRDRTKWKNDIQNRSGDPR